MSPVNRLDDTDATDWSPAIDAVGYDLREAVKLPAREDEAEWTANNLYEFHKQISMLYGTISEYCTAESCPRMTAGNKHEYLWTSDRDQMQMDQSAPHYIQHLLDWIQEQLDDETIFPTKPEDKFPENFKQICQTIARRMFRVYAHVYHHHLDRVRYLKEEAHMNTSLKHFIYFVQEFDLVPASKLEPLQDYIRTFTC